MILGKINVKYKPEEVKLTGLAMVGEKSGLYEILTKLAQGKCIILIDNKLAYIQDIRANYRDGELYIPVFSCKEVSDDKVTATYDNKIEKVMLHTYKDGLLRDYITIIPNPTIPEAYKIYIKGIPLSRHITENDKKARDLFYKYIPASYGYTDSEFDVFDYVRVQKGYQKDSQRKLLKEHGLEFYGEFVDMEYRDVRNWKLSELQKCFTDKELHTDKPFGWRRLVFELELYTRIYDEVYWKEWTVGTMKELLNDKTDYLKYKEKGIYLIFKKRWLNIK